jgi:hypothetical protein
LFPKVEIQQVDPIYPLKMRLCLVNFHLPRQNVVHLQNE